MSSYICERCDTLQMYCAAVATARCMRCGAVHSTKGGIEVISPVMAGITSPTCRHSPWMPSHTRPVSPGYYECVFNGDGRELMLWWNGSRFTHNGVNVRSMSLHKWRGQWLLASIA